METNFRNGPMTVRIEETIEDQNHDRCNPILITPKDTINDIIVTDFFSYWRWCSSLLFVILDFVKHIHWQLIDAIFSVFFKSRHKSMLMVFVITEARERSIDRRKQTIFLIRRLIKLLPGGESFLLILYLTIMLDFLALFTF